MLANYFRTAFRFISKNLTFTLINICGLTAGITAFLLICLYLQNELSYDRHIKDAAQIYRLVGIQEPDGIDKQHVSYTSGAWAQYIQENIPGVKDAFRLAHSPSGIIEVEGINYSDSYVCFSENNILEYMGYPILEGGLPQHMLSLPNQAVISRETAENIFGTTQVLGKRFHLAGYAFHISGVFENKGFNSHYKTNIILSFSTVEPDLPFLNHFGNNSVATYLVINPGTDPEYVANSINQKQQNLEQEEMYRGMMKNTFYLQNIRDIYLRSGHLKFQMYTHSGNINYIYIFTLIAVLVLGIACINFINLATANAAKRQREVGLRKVLGAARMDLWLQFLGESFIITVFSLVGALALVELFLPAFNSLLGTELHVDFLNNRLFSTGLILLWLIVGLFSGFYPAMYLSRFEPGNTLRADTSSGKPRSAWLRKILVTLQFTISTAMILATLVVMHQIRHMQSKDLGYNPHNVIVVPLLQSTSYLKLQNLRNSLLAFPEISHIGISSNFNGVAGTQSTITTADSIPVRLMVRYGYVDPDFFPTMQMRFLQGRNFSHDFGTDPFQAVIINRSTQRALGWDDAIGKRFHNYLDDSYEFLTVIGVIEDYNYYSLHNPIEPAVYIFRPDHMPVLNIRYQTSDPQSLLVKINQAYQMHFPGYHFTSWFVDDLLNRQYKTEINTMKIFSWFALLCILISCLGLFGLTIFMVNQRRKEISIRKVLGGSIWRINLMLLLSFLRWIFISAFIALPVTWSLMNDWLNSFVYRIEINWLHITITLLLVLSVAALTILTLTTRAALQNPSEAIKYE